jgi:uncharacterized membrane protein
VLGTFEDKMSDVAQGFEALGVAILIVGTSISFLRAGVDLIRRRADSYQRLRSVLGRSILLGLEVLVAADLIRTVAVSPTLANVGGLALIVLIRTFLSFSLEVEIEGRLPWQRADTDATASH